MCPRPRRVPQPHPARWRCAVTRHIWSSAKRVSRLPAWAAAVAVAFGLGAIVGPMAVSAHQVSTADASGTPAPGGFPRMDHVFVIMMENTSYKALLSPGNPNTKFIQQMAATDGLATRYFGVTHPSLPNYIAATSGQ